MLISRFLLQCLRFCRAFFGSKISNRYFVYNIKIFISLRGFYSSTMNCQVDILDTRVTLFKPYIYTNK